MDIHKLKPEDRSRWDEYVAGNPTATIFHMAGWKSIMEGVFGLRTQFIYATEAGEMMGVLPLVEIKSRVFGHHFTSLPTAICSQSGAAAQELAEFAKNLVIKTNARYILLRDSYHDWPLDGFGTSDEHCASVIELPENLEDYYAALDKNRRRQIRLGEKHGLIHSYDNGLLTSFYPVYLRAMRERGTPPFNFRFFSEVFEKFSNQFQLILVSTGESPISGGIVGNHRETTFCTWSGILSQYYKIYVSQTLFYNTIQYAHRRGSHRIDLGRSMRGSGAHAYKKAWNSITVPLFQQYFVNGDGNPPAVGGRKAEGPISRLMMEVWKRMPLSLTEQIGPALRKRVPFG
jgi:FemAB-related protein (PEP-CTERM system-associated)